MDRDPRRVFDEDPELYQRARPGYPAELFDDLGRLARVGPGSVVAEVGPGTGQATRGLVALGARVVAVELGPGMAAVLRREVPQAEVVVSAFEDWAAPAGSVDLVACFTAWHWMDPATRAAKAADVLRLGGALATVTTQHVRTADDDAFAVEVQRCYAAWDPTFDPDSFLPTADEVRPAYDEVDASPLFEPAVRLRYLQQRAYTTASFVALLATYSPNRAMPPERRDGLLGCIGDLVDRRFSGRITRTSLHELRLARRLGA